MRFILGPKTMPASIYLSCDTKKQSNASRPAKTEDGVAARRPRRRTFLAGVR
jgi:hypothetical protein